MLIPEDVVEKKGLVLLLTGIRRNGNKRLAYCQTKRIRTRLGRTINTIDKSVTK
jgi:hypothetical protein